MEKNELGYDLQNIIVELEIVIDFPKYIDGGRQAQRLTH